MFKKQLIKVSKIIMAAILVLTLMTVNKVVVDGEEITKKNLMFAETGISNMKIPSTTDAAWDTLWYGSKDNPMQWNLLNPKETGYGGNSLLLLSKGIVGSTLYGSDKEYENSSLRTFLQDNMSAILTDKEQLATLDSVWKDNLHFYGDMMCDFPITGDKWFPPSAKLLLTSQYGFLDNDENSDLNRGVGNAASFIASTAIDDTQVVGIIQGDGTFDATKPSNSANVRATSNINPDSILFVSAATGGKKSNSIGQDSLTVVDENAGLKDYKLTLEDSTQTLTISNLSRTNDIISFNYKAIGDGNSLSAIVTDSSGTEIISYGQLKDITDVKEGLAGVKLPAGFEENNYKLQLFSEQANGDEKTDYAGEIVALDVNSAKELSHIEVGTPPKKINYPEGTYFDPFELTVLKTFTDGKTETVPYNSTTASVFSFSPSLTTRLTRADTKVEITLDGKKCTQAIEVTEKKVTGISITQAPSKVKYIEGEEFDPNGLKIHVTYDNKEEVDIRYYDHPTDFTFTPELTQGLKHGFTTITIGYGGQTCTQQVEAGAKAIKSCTIKHLPTITKYSVGQKFEATGLTINVLYDNGKTEEVSYASEPIAFSFEAYPDKNPELTLGVHEINGWYRGNKFLTAIPITVVEKQTASIKVLTEPKVVNYLEGSTFDPTDLVIKDIFDNGTEETIPYKGNEAKFSFTPDLTTKLTPNDTSVTITYDGHTCQQLVTVRDKKADVITVTATPTKLEYIEGNKFDPTGLELRVVFDNGDIENIPYQSTNSKFKFTPDLNDKLKTGDTSVTIDYDEKECTQAIAIEVREKVITSMVVDDTAPTKTKYIEGNKFDPTGLVINVAYDNGDTELVDYASRSDELSFTPNLDTELTTSNDSITIGYKNETCSQPITVVPKQLKSIAVLPGFVKKEYIEGEYFNPAGLIIRETYDNGETRDVIYTGHESDFAFSPTVSDKLTTEDTKITITYKGSLTCEQVITVRDKKADVITVTTPPSNLKYIEGNKFDPTGLVLNVVFDNGDIEDIPYQAINSKFKFTPDLNDKLKTGDTSVTIDYDGKECTQDITVATKQLQSIAVKTKPSKADYTEGNTFEPTGLVITKTYNNGDSENVTYAGNEGKFTFNPAIDEKLVVGTTTVTITYGGQTCKQDITVATKQLQSIAVGTPPSMVGYIEGNTFDPTGLVIAKTYDNGDSENVTYAGNESKFTFSPAINDRLVVGTTAITITYEGKTCEQGITVATKQLESIAVGNEPSKVDYIEGNTFDPSGLVITKTYDNGDSENVTYTGNEGKFAFSPAINDRLVVGTTAVTITYEGITCEQAITVTTKQLKSIAVGTPPSKVDYIEGNTFDPTGLVITKTYDNGDSENVTYAGNEGKFTFSPTIDAKLVVGITTVTITYEGITCEQAITVATKQLKSIAVSTKPSKLDYIEGNTFDPSGLVITKTYDNGDSENVTYAGNEGKFTFSPNTDTELKTTDSAITITYEGKTCDQGITVATKQLKSIAVSTKPSKVDYIEGNTFDPSGLVITKTYDNGDSENVTYAGNEGKFTFSPNLKTPLVTTTNKVDITYEGKICTQVITVATKQLQSIAVKTKSSEDKYIEGNTFDPTGLVITKIYDNEDKEDVAYSGHESEFTFSPAINDKLVVGTTAITITYEGKECTQSIAVRERKATSITLKTSSDITDYAEGKRFAPKGLVINAIFDNGDHEDVAYTGHENEFTFSPDIKTKLKLENTVVTINYDGQTCKQDITVHARTALTIKVDTPPKSRYIEGNTFDPTGLIIEGVFDNGVTENVSYDEYESDFTFNPDINTKLGTGDRSVTITYEGVTCNLPITVATKQLENIAVSTKPLKVVYIEGNLFKPEGLVITKTYDNKETIDVPYKGNEGKFTFNPSLNTPLETTMNKVDITYEGKTCEQGITVAKKQLQSIAVSTKPSKDNYIEGNTFDPTGLIITKTYDNDTTEDIAYANNEAKFTFTPNLNTPLKTTMNKVDIIYEGKKCEQPITVNKKTLSQISVKRVPTNTKYIEGNTFDPTGLVMEAVFNNGDKEDVSYADYKNDFAFTPTVSDTLQVSDTKVVITYNNQTCIQAITVVPKQLQSIVVSNPPTKIRYTEGDTFDPTGLIIAKIYDNGETINVPYKGNEGGFVFNPTLSDPLNILDTKISIVFEGMTCTQIIDVALKSNEKEIISFTIPMQIGDTIIDKVNRTIHISMPYGTNSKALTPHITSSPYATINPQTEVVTNFIDPVQYIVTAQDGTIQSYQVTVEILPEVKLIEGKDGIWQENSGEPLSFRVKTDFSNFLNVLINGEILDPINYTAREGSIIIELKPEYLKTLPVGKYEISISTKVGNIATSFTINEGSDPVLPQKPEEPSTGGTTDIPDTPSTGDDTNVGIYLIFSLLSLSGIFETLRKKKDYLS